MEVLKASTKPTGDSCSACSTVNCFPSSKNRGYPVSGGYFAFPDAGETVTMLERMSLVKDAVGMVPIPADYIYETFGIPKPDEK